jgi:DNA polymerase III epsilon subunit-like protein
MNYLIFDTETTGLPKSKNTTIGKWHEKWPYIVQISWILYDGKKNIIKDIQDFIVKLPENIYIPEQSSKIHGITNEISQKKGTIIQEIIKHFNIVLSVSDMIIGHNIEFDINMIRAEYKRNNCIEPFKTLKYIPTYCTMKESIELCKIEAINKYGKYFKWPKLVELHKKLFNTEPRNLHNSLTDIYVTLRCFYMMVYNIDLLVTSKSYIMNTKYIYN